MKSFIGPRWVVTKGQRWRVDEGNPREKLYPALYPVTFVSQQTGEERHGMLRRPRGRTTQAELDDAFRRSAA